MMYHVPILLYFIIGLIIYLCLTYRSIVSSRSFETKRGFYYREFVLDSDFRRLFFYSRKFNEKLPFITGHFYTFINVMRDKLITC